MALIDNLVSYWRLDEASGDAIDAHGSNDLTDNNTVGTGAGVISNARAFVRANSEFFSHADNTDLSTGDIDFSFSCWVNCDDPGIARQIIVAKDDDNLGREYIIATNDGGTSNLRFTVLNGGSVAQVNSSTDLSMATWHHIVVWHDASANQIGIVVDDGTPATQSHSGGVANSTGTFQIGAREYSGAENYFGGLIDEVGFWKRVLTSGEITELYNGGAGLAYPFAAGGASPPEVPYRLRGGGIAEIAWPVWGQSFRF